MNYWTGFWIQRQHRRRILVLTVITLGTLGVGAELAHVPQGAIVAGLVLLALPVSAGYYRLIHRPPTIQEDSQARAAGAGGDR